MAGLRQKQKEQRRLAIAAAAIRLFGEKGFHKTRMEDIAGEVGVSGQTVFNYYPSKQSILFEFLKDADRSGLEEASTSIELNGEPVSILSKLVEVITEHQLKVMSPSLWREILPLILFNPRDALPEAYQRSNAELVAGIETFLQRMQAAGMLRQEADLGFAAFMINDYGHLQLVRLVNQDEPDWDSFRLNNRQTAQLLFDGMGRHIR